METLKADTRLKVVFLSLPQRNQAVLEYFFASTGHGSFALTSAQNAEAAIFDFDNLESRHHWESFHASTGKPGILLSVSPQQQAMTVWVQKPVAPAAMLEAATKVQNGAWSTGPAEASPEPLPTQEAAPVAAETSVAATEALAVEASPPLPAAQASAPVAPPASTQSTDEAAPAPQAAKAVALAEALAPASASLPPAAAPSPRVARPRATEPSTSLWSWIWEALFGSKKTAPKPREQETAATEASKVAPGPALAAQSGTMPDAPLPEPAAAEPEAERPPAPVEATAPAEAETAPALPVPETPKPLAAPLASHALGNEATAAAAPPPEPETPAPKPRPQASLREMADAPRFCGERADLPETDFGSTPDLFYNFGEHLISALREAYLVGAKWRAPTRLDLEFGAVTYVPAENRAYIDFTEAVLKAELCTPQPRRYKVRMVGVQEFADMQEHLALAHKLDRFDAILWRLALETSQGRLPQGTDVSKEFYLKSWPNMTRFQPTPHAMRIAALWATRGASLLETARALEIPQRYVFAFYNAAFSADLVTDNGAHIKRAIRRSHKNRGGFARIFDWLRT